MVSPNAPLALILSRMVAQLLPCWAFDNALASMTLPWRQSMGSLIHGILIFLGAFALVISRSSPPLYMLLY
jgi:hypothetical protein